MRTLSLKLLATLLFLGVAFTSCDNDDDDVISGLEDRNIIIDDTQTFNMKNFAASFEQMFKDSDHWQWDFSHEIVDGKAVVTYQNIKVLGGFGDKLIIFTHNFDAEGVITSTVGELYHDVYWDDDSKITLTYKFDAEGYIVEFTEKGYVDFGGKPAKSTTNKTMTADEDEVRDIVDLIYNVDKQLIAKHHQELSEEGKMSLFNTNKIQEKIEEINAGSESWEEYFTYNEKKEVIKYERSNWGTDQYEEYIYDTSGNMITESLYYQGSLNNSYSYQYDSSGRLIYRYYNDYKNEGYAFEYYEDFYREIDYDFYDGFKRIDDWTDSSSFEINIKYWGFGYDGEVFDCCTTKEYEYLEGVNQRLVAKKEYYEGTPENLVLVGYTIIDSRDPANNYRETKESIYNASDTLLYYVEYEVSNSSVQSHQVYMPDGTAINDFNIDNSYMWIELLISYINIT